MYPHGHVHCPQCGFSAVVLGASVPGWQCPRCTPVVGTATAPGRQWEDDAVARVLVAALIFLALAAGIACLVSRLVPVW